MLLSALGLGACARDVFRKEVSMRVGTPAQLIKREIHSSPFNLIAFERMHEHVAPVTLYIEGDGKAHTSRTRALFNATPVNPVSLHLATRDNSQNVGYLARPCQYTEEFEHPLPQIFCGGEYWTGKEYSPEVLKVYNDIMDDMRRRYGVTLFNLVGYDGGATLAALLAAERKDVLTLRTVSGRFDMVPLKPQLSSLRFVPQHHFVGGADTITPPAHLNTYIQALGNTACVETTLIQEAEHEKGWVEKWPELLESPLPTCTMPPPDDPAPRPKPVYAPRRIEDFKK